MLGPRVPALAVSCSLGLAALTLGARPAAAQAVDQPIDWHAPAGAAGSMTPPGSASAPGPAEVPPPERPVPCDQSAPEAVVAAARAHLEAAQGHIQADAWADAERALRLSLRYHDSPDAHALLGAALVGLLRFDEAYNELDGTIELAARCAQADQSAGRASRYEPTVATALRYRDALTARVALLGVRVPDGAPAGLEVQVNGVPLARRDWGRVRAYAPGDARVLAEAPGYARFVGTSALEPRRTHWIDVALAPEAVARTTRSGSSALFAAGVVVGSAGGVAAITGGLLFFAARGEYDALRRDCGGGCPATGAFPGRIDRGEALETAGVGVFWAGVGLAALGVTLAVVSGGPTVERRVTAGPAVRPGVTLGGVGLDVRF